jgi:alcohol dehydrogenase
MVDSAQQHLAVQVTEPGGRPTLRRVDTPAPEPGWVRVAVHACGVCHADAGTVASARPATGFPITAGHEVAGVIEALGEQVTGWSAGDRVVVGWFGGSCGHCTACRSGDVVHCRERRIPGLSYPGGWAESVTVPAPALTRVPDGLSMVEAAPFGCAGVTAFNAVRHGGVRPGGRVAVFGIGGLGHFAVQFAARLGYDTIAMSRGAGKEELARSLGARHYIDTAQQPPGAALRAMGGADLVISTSAATEPLAEIIDGLVPHGRLTVIGFDGRTLPVRLDKLVMHARTISGHLTGSPVDTEQTMGFALASGIRPRIQVFPLAQADEALQAVLAGTVRFRAVLTTYRCTDGVPGE